MSTQIRRRLQPSPVIAHMVPKNPPMGVVRALCGAKVLVTAKTNMDITTPTEPWVMCPLCECAQMLDGAPEPMHQESADHMQQGRLF